MARLLADALVRLGIPLYLPVESNMVFCVLSEEALAKACTEYDLKYWFRDKKVVRIATTFATKEEDILRLISLLTK